MKEDDIQIPDKIIEFKNDKTSSQRLRNVLFRYWEQNKPNDDFDSYYKQQMNKFINAVKDKLN